MSYFYPFVFIFLVFTELLYFRIANYFNITDKPNERSLHAFNTIRGGGIIFYIAALFYFIYKGAEYPYFFIGLSLLSFISFWDDISSLPSRNRIIVQFIAIGFISFQIHSLFATFCLLLPYLILTVGIINAYNFMDGINGITGAYSLVTFISLWYINKYYTHFVDNQFIIISILGLLVFLFFNFRTKAKCFAGDIGSVSIAFMIVFLISKLIFTTHHYSYLLFLTLYGIDTIFTIIYRIYLKENIFKAHKLHLFQILVYRGNFSHLQVASIYAIIQLIVDILIIYLSIYPVKIQINGISFLLLLVSIVYFLVKRKYLKAKGLKDMCPNGKTVQ